MQRAASLIATRFTVHVLPSLSRRGPHSYSKLSYLSKVVYVNLPDLRCLVVHMTPLEFRRDLWYQKRIVAGISCGVVCVILCLTVFTKYRHVRY